MRATLLHNPHAGARNTPRIDELEGALRDIGWDVRIRPVDELDAAVGDPGDLLVVAGGDGTVGAVAKRVAGTNVPMTVIPTGSVNNVARSLGIGVEPRAVVLGLKKAVEGTIDLGVVTSAAGEERFVEGFGVGLFAYVLGERATRANRRLPDAHDLLAGEAEIYAPRRVRVEVDGIDHTGDWLIAEVMNVRTVGPALALAPDAKTDDGELDVVLVREDARHALVAHLRRAAEVGDLVLPTFETMRAKRVVFHLDDRWTHVDDAPTERSGDVTVGIWPRAVRVMIPRP